MNHSSLTQVPPDLLAGDGMGLANHENRAREAR